MTRRLLGPILLLLLVPPGCEDEPAPGCKDGHMVGSVCGGVPNDAVCEEDYCTEGVECAQVFQVDSGAAFNDAVAGATPGTCIALAPGNYGSVALPIGVSLLGKGADLVTVASIESRARPFSRPVKSPISTPAGAASRRNV